MGKNEDRVSRLVDRMATLCDLSGLPVVGFVVMVDNPETDTLTAQANSHIDPVAFDDYLRAYVDSRL